MEKAINNKIMAIGIVAGLCLTACGNTATSTNTTDEEISLIANKEEAEVTYLLSKSVTYYGDEISSIIEYEYDDDGNLVRQTNGYSDGTIYEEGIYDSNGNVIKSIGFDENGNELITSEYEYDSNGNCINLVTYNEGQVSQIIEREYDSNDNEIKRYMSEGDGNRYLGVSI